MRLWRCELPCLQGYYASYAVVVAPDKAQAEARVLDAVRGYVKREAEWQGFVGAVDGYSWDDDWEEQVGKLMRQVEAEAKGVVEVEDGWIVNVRS